MANRDEIKENNRARIKAAAAKIIRQEGMHRLTMRHLADVAGVSLRTPYNLFGSKTDVLIAILLDAQGGLVEKFRQPGEELELERLLRAIDYMENFFGSDEDFFRNIYWAIMSSEQHDARLVAFEQTIALGQSVLAAAAENGELDAETDPKALGKHLVIQLMAILGMWGSGYFDNAQSATHIRRALYASLLCHATGKSRPMLLTRYSEITRSATGRPRSSDRQ